MNKAKLVKYTSLINWTLSENETQLFRSKDQNDPNAALKEIYQYLQIQYPKFYKMDNLSKSAFLCAELLMKDHNLGHIAPEKIGIFLANHCSSLDTDEVYHKKTFENPSIQAQPALFVYTLPNIMIGELSIRHKLKGEQSMWISEHFQGEFITKYVNSLFDEGLIEAGIIGWVNYYQNIQNVSLMLVANNYPEDKQLPDFSIDSLPNVIY